MINLIIVKNSSVVLILAFDDLKSTSYENSTSITDFSAAAYVIISFIDFDSTAFLADHVSFITSRFQSLQNRTIVNVRREHDQMKKKIQILSTRREKRSALPSRS